MRQAVSFTKCPECGTSIGSQGLSRHRKTRHGVDSERTSPKRQAPRRSLAERLAAIETCVSCGEMVGEHTLPDNMRSEGKCDTCNLFDRL